jgi:hypothetical protein
MLYSGGWINNFLYAQGTLIGSTNLYKTTRKIVFQGEFSPFTRTAKGRTYGFSLFSHIELGAIFRPVVQLRPFIKADYMWIHRQGFTEQGASSINLVVKRHNADLLRLEEGLELSYCIPREQLKPYLPNLIPYLTVGAVSELRFVGQSEEASFVDLQCPMESDGLFPTQNLLFLETGFLGNLAGTPLDLGFNYRFERGALYAGQTVSFQIRANF